jgi:hypothetical protein
MVKQGEVRSARPDPSRSAYLPSSRFEDRFACFEHASSQSSSPAQLARASRSCFEASSRSWPARSIGTGGRGKSVRGCPYLTPSACCFISGIETAVTASTGIAAINVGGGQTLHSWAGPSSNSLPFVSHTLVSFIRSFYWLLIYVSLWTGVGLAQSSAPDLLAKILRTETRTNAEGKTTTFTKSGRNFVLERWLETGVLVIDEISMVDGAFVSDLSLSGA